MTAIETAGKSSETAVEPTFFSPSTQAVFRLIIRRKRDSASAPTKRNRTVLGVYSRLPIASGWKRSNHTTSKLSRDGRVMEVLSEQLCQGWLEGYLLTGRHGLFSCY